LIFATLDARPTRATCHHGSVLGRRIALIAAMVLFTAVLVSSVSTRQRAETRAVAPPRPSAPSVVERVHGELPAARTIRARLGDAVSISVRPAVADTALIDALGLRAEASPDLPGVLEFVATTPGRFPVVLEGTGQRLGTVVVSDAGS
jgi:hypothetical protein